MRRARRRGAGGRFGERDRRVATAAVAATSDDQGTNLWAGTPGATYKTPPSPVSSAGSSTSSTIASESVRARSGP